MSARALEAIVGKAVVSDRFRAGILNGQRAELIRPFGLEPEETSAVLSIHAQDLSEFALAIEQLTLCEPSRPAARYDAWRRSDRPLS
jgi:hypothetical protein